MADNADSSPDQSLPDNGTDPPAVTPKTKTSSVLGLTLVSALNVACLAFIAFHFAGHADEPAPISVAPAQEISFRPGNIDLAPATQLVLTVASHVERVTTERVAAVEPGVEGDSDRDPSPVDIETPKEPGEHWVQFGALSKGATAHRYWATLQKLHQALLGNLESRIFGPDQVGGSLYHLRVGPMIAVEATDLCAKLKRAGADCFCVPSTRERPGPAVAETEPVGST